MERKHLFFLFIIVATISLAGCNDNTTYKEDETEGPRYDYIGAGEVFPVRDIKTSYNNITGDYRPTYNNMSDEEYEWIFGNLPPFPDDFYSLVTLVYEGKVTDFSRIGKEYWLQPEFYTSWYGLYEKYYLNNSKESWCPEGYGCFPLLKEANAEKGTTIVADTYFRTGVGVESYQGMVIRPTIPNTAKNVLGETVFEQNPKEVSKYFNIKIKNPDNEIFNSFKDNLFSHNVEEDDWFVVLKPTYSEITDKYGNYIRYEGFPDDWVRLLNYEIEISPDCPSGNYVFSIDIIEPSFSINQEFYFSTEHERYGRLYNPVGRLFQSNLPHFQLILHVS